MAEVKAQLMLETGNRWWFHIARLATIVLIVLGIVKDTGKAADWLARNGVWFRAVIK